MRLLAPHLTPENHRTLLDAAAYKSKREVEQHVVAMAPRPAVPSSLRKLPSPVSRGHRPPDSPAAEGEDGPRRAPVVTRRPAVVAPLAPERYRLQVTISGEARDMLRRIQDLLRHSVPDGDPAAIVERALGVLLAELERRKLAKTDRPHRHGNAGVWVRESDVIVRARALGVSTQVRFEIV